MEHKTQNTEGSATSETNITTKPQHTNTYIYIYDSSLFVGVLVVCEIVGQRCSAQAKHNNNDHCCYNC